MTTAARSAPSHENSTCVKWHNCRRPECRDRYNARRRAMRAGIIAPRPLVDAEPVRQHILELQDAGLALTRIARFAGLPHTTIVNFVRSQASRGRGRKQQTTPQTAAKILAVRPFTTVGTIRRIQALIAVGWPARRIAARAGVSARWLVELRDTTVVNIVTSTKIAAAYKELQHLKPEKNGVHAGHAKRARARAAANRWPPPKYWADRMDAIDDPHFTPLHGVTRGELLAADGRELLALGVRIDQAAARLGVTRNHLQQEMLRHPQTDTAEQAEAAA